MTYLRSDIFRRWPHLNKISSKTSNQKQIWSIHLPGKKVKIVETCIFVGLDGSRCISGTEQMARCYEWVWNEMWNEKNKTLTWAKSPKQSFFFQHSLFKLLLSWESEAERLSSPLFFSLGCFKSSQHSTAVNSSCQNSTLVFSTAANGQPSWYCKLLFHKAFFSLHISDLLCLTELGAWAHVPAVPEANRCAPFGAVYSYQCQVRIWSPTFL